MGAVRPREPKPKTQAFGSRALSRKLWPWEIIPSDTRVEFTGTDHFEALSKAERWFSRLGLSMGVLEKNAPTGLRLGSARPPKWRRLSAAERLDLDGVMLAGDGGFRLGPITVFLRRRVTLRCGD